jgi:hypothetical protein
MPKWWWWCVPGLRKSWKLEMRRVEVLSSIGGERMFVELMAERVRRPDDPIDSALLMQVLGRVNSAQEQAKIATHVGQLTDLQDDAELAGVFASYFCPTTDIQSEGQLVIDQIEVWGIPRSAITKLRQTLAQKLVSSDPTEARSALRALYEERDSWRDYTEDYEDRMWQFTRNLSWATPSFILLAIVGLYFSTRFSQLLPLSLLFAGAAGSCVSVMGKMPALDVSLAGGLDAYGRRVLSRIGIGVMASLIGCALLAWGFFPVSIQNQTFTDALNACTSNTTTQNIGIKALIVLGVAILLGFSERALTSLEQQMFGKARESTK